MNDASKAYGSDLLLILAAYSEGEILGLGFLLALAAVLILLLLIWFENAAKAAANFVFSYLPGAFLILEKKHRNAEAKLQTSSDELELAAIVERTALLEEHRARLSSANKLVDEELRRDSEILRKAKSKMRQVINNASGLDLKRSQLSCRCQECGKRIFFKVEDYEKSIECPTDKCSCVIRLV